ncbi:Hypothetical predicted protein [Mytilus galloprovincialis]|nr:Hypothetical predicted protein [Mytilus galloprovincialis]
MVLEYFCTDHDTMCCRSCMASAHRSCEKLLPIEVSAKRVKSSAMYEEIAKDVTTLYSAINELQDTQRQGMTNLKDSKMAIKEDVKAKLEKLIQEIEAALMSEIDSIQTSQTKLTTTLTRYVIKNKRYKILLNSLNLYRNMDLKVKYLC